MVSNIIKFPNPETSKDPDGIICITDLSYLNPENIIHAYREGIFPWTASNFDHVPWFCPPKRAVLDFEELHVPRSLRKARKNSSFTYTIDKSFDEVISACATVKRKRQRGTWIIKEIVESFLELHKRGIAHSVEVWNEKGELIGGLYGMDAGGVFSGESMFHYVSNASKLAFLFLVDHLKSRGATWVDIQVMSKHFEILGAKKISRGEFLRRLKEAQNQNLKLFD